MRLFVYIKHRTTNGSFFFLSTSLIPKPHTTEKMVKGYVYCLSNPSFAKSTYKIGFTTKPPTNRAMELFQTGLPTPFKIEFSKKVKHARDSERILHKYFRRQRINENREFFNVDLPKIRSQFHKLPGTWWESHSSDTSTSSSKSDTLLESFESWSLKQRRLRRKCKLVSK